MAELQPLDSTAGLRIVEPWVARAQPRVACPDGTWVPTAALVEIARRRAVKADEP